MDLTDLGDRLERMQPIEERAGIRLEAIGAYQCIYKDKAEAFLFMGGELHPREGLNLTRTVKLLMAVYDDKGRVVHQDSTDVTPAGFYAFKPFTIWTTCPKIAIGKIRIVPK